MMWRDWYELCKPRVVFLMMITAWVGMLLASRSLDWGVFFYASVGIGCAASAGAILNQLLEQDIDRLMRRTHHRPLAQQRIRSGQACWGAVFLACMGLGLLYWKINGLTCLLTALSLMGYALVYTLFLKKVTPQNIVIGGLAGAAPPLLGWTAVSGHIDPYGLLLVLIIFVWTPPHFWALAIYREKDYAQSPWPMLPITHGVPFTKMSILLYSILLILVTLLPCLTGMSGWLYGLVWAVVNLIFSYYVLVLYRHPDPIWGWHTFRYSIVYLFFIFLGLLIDHYV